MRQLRRATKLRQGVNFDIRVFHDSILKNGPVPLAILPDLVVGAETVVPH